MTDFDKWLTNEPDARCEQCNKVLVDDFYEDLENDRIFCDLRCQAEYEQDKAERSYESYLDNYYGGEGPVTQQERYEQAWREKRGL